MSVGYLVTLGDGSLGANDSVSGAQSSFTIDSLLGTGSWSWTGTSGGTPYSGFTDTGTYFLGDDGNVYFTPDSVFPDSGSGAVDSAPAYSTGAYHGTEGADLACWRRGGRFYHR
ncbi:hypothetical protein U5922_013735 [Aquicoccus sp. G2-2]|uniref:hypothetical protein n=1 Tax=Aquicoccus sp. G2-2 TaxID=3092120 RepID=UPI002AE00DA6|nr:hypothetical protein [Aquicoccus sp. G2-2]MEA1114465.1 hypothetical protein [Aquicoccus sp. G2-2]